MGEIKVLGRYVASDFWYRVHYILMDPEDGSGEVILRQVNEPCGQGEICVSTDMRLRLNSAREMLETLLEALDEVSPRG